MANSPPAKRPRDDAEDNCIVMRIINFSKMKEGKTVWSHPKVISNFKWKLCAEKENDQLSIGLYCFQEEISNIWGCEVSCQMSAINLDSTKNLQSKVMSFSCYWWNSNEGLHWEDEKFSEIMDPKGGFIKNDEIVIEAHVKVFGRSGDEFRKKPKLDFRSPSDTSDVTLKIKDVDFYVHKQANFIHHSPKFHKYFNEDEKGKESFNAVLKDVDPDAFENMLRMIYRVGQPFQRKTFGQFQLEFEIRIDERVCKMERRLLRNSNSTENIRIADNAKSVAAVLNLANLFEIEGIMDEADKSLDLMEFDTEVLFFWAEKYKLFYLQDCVFENITAADIKNIKQSDEYKGLSEQTKEKLFDKYIKLTSTDNK